jgi:hypothetical protein
VTEHVAGGDAQPTAQDPTPDEQSPAAYPATDSPALGADADAGTTRALAAFLTITPFLDLHERAGHPEQHRGRARLCFALDLVVRAAAIALLLGLIAAVAWKVIAPLPPFDRPIAPDQKSVGPQQ